MLIPRAHYWLRPPSADWTLRNAITLRYNWNIQRLIERGVRPTEQAMADYRRREASIEREFDALTPKFLRR